MCNHSLSDLKVIALDQAIKICSLPGTAKTDVVKEAEDYFNFLISARGMVLRPINELDEYKNRAE